MAGVDGLQPEFVEHATTIDVHAVSVVLISL